VSERPLPSQRGRPLVIGHRGAKAYLPENTLPAYALAIEQGADMLEIDLHRSRDGAIPIVHDEGLEEIGREGEVKDVSLDELRELASEALRNAPPLETPLGGSGGRVQIRQPSSAPEFDGVPILEQVLDRFGDEIPFNLEIKTAKGGIPYEGLQQMALDQVVTRGLLADTVFSSFWDPVLNELRGRSPDARLAVLVSPRAPERIFERARSLGAEAVNPYFLLANEDLVSRAHGEGLAVYVYTVDDPEEMKRLLDLGVDGIFSNRPDVLRRVVDSRV
jgi:glycerophosphoryl diester phosphodiesterase